MIISNVWIVAEPIVQPLDSDYMDVRTRQTSFISDQIDNCRIRVATKVPVCEKHVMIETIRCSQFLNTGQLIFEDSRLHAKVPIRERCVSP